LVPILYHIGSFSIVMLLDDLGDPPIARYGMSAQGYYFSRPLPPESLEDWIRTSSWGINEDASNIAA
jgi:hypothetical protein